MSTPLVSAVREFYLGLRNHTEIGRAVVLLRMLHRTATGLYGRWDGQDDERKDDPAHPVESSHHLDFFLYIKREEEKKEKGTEIKRKIEEKIVTLESGSDVIS